MPEKTQSEPLLKSGQYSVEKVVNLSFFDLTGERARTSGSSNKTYALELHVSKDNTKAQLYSMWGAVGGNQTIDYRHYTDVSKARKEFESIIKSKKRKGYQEIDVAQRAYGSDEAKQIIKPVVFTNTDQLLKTNVSKLHKETQSLIVNLMGATNAFVVQTLNCPLGQLSNTQIDDGRVRLNKAKDIVNQLNGKPIVENSSTYNEILTLTNEFYSLIPHNLGSGFRGKMDHLLLNEINRIVQKESDLDTLLDAKSIGAALKTDSNIDDQYNTLNADFTYVEHSDKLFEYIKNYFHNSANARHGFRDVKVKNVWTVERKDSEKDYFLKNLSRIAKECGKHTFEKEALPLTKNPGQWVPTKRLDLDNDLINQYNQANTWLCWHGTRSANVVGITKRGLMIRPAGAIHTGSLYGDGVYFAWQSTKSLNYCDNGYWTGNNNSSSSSRYMFLLDVALGNMYQANGPTFFKSPPKGFHSVYGKAGKSGVLNDEMITYDFEQKDKQSRIRYLLEIV